MNSCYNVLNYAKANDLRILGKDKKISVQIPKILRQFSTCRIKNRTNRTKGNS